MSSIWLKRENADNRKERTDERSIVNGWKYSLMLPKHISNPINLNDTEA
jgi:hypothetical protein